MNPIVLVLVLVLETKRTNRGRGRERRGGRRGSVPIQTLAHGLNQLLRGIWLLQERGCSPGDKSRPLRVIIVTTRVNNLKPGSCASNCLANSRPVRPSGMIMSVSNRSISVRYSFQTNKAAEPEAASKTRYP